MTNFSFDAIIEALEDVFEALHYGTGILNLGMMGIIMLCTIIGLLISLVVSVIVFILEAIPLYKLAKKTDRDRPWLAFIPIFGKYFRLYVLTDIPGKKPLYLLDDKIKIENRFLSFWYYVGIVIFGPTLISVVVGILQFLPLIGQILGAVISILYFAPAVASAIMEYGYLRDVANVFMADKKKNRTVSIIITVLDALVTGGFARVIYLYTMLNKEPIEAELGE